MAKRKKLTVQEIIYIAANAMLKAGEEVNAPDLHIRLPHIKSRTTIIKHVRAWRLSQLNQKEDVIKNISMPNRFYEIMFEEVAKFNKNISNELETKLSIESSQNEDLISEMQVLEALVEQLNKQITQEKQNNSKLTTQIKNISTKVKLESSTNKATVKELRNQVSAAHKDVDSIKAEQAELKAQHQTMQSSAYNSEILISDLSIQLTDVKEKNTQLTIGIEKLKFASVLEANTNKSTVKELQNQVSIANKELVSIQNINDKLNTQQQIMQNSLDKSEYSINDLSEKLIEEKEKNTLENNQTSLEGLNIQLADITKKLNNTPTQSNHTNNPSNETTDEEYIQMFYVAKNETDELKTVNIELEAEVNEQKKVIEKLKSSRVTKNN